MWDSLINTLTGILTIPDQAGKAVAFGATVWATLSDYRMWRSIAWIALGVLVAILGLAVWNRKAIISAAKTSGQAATKGAV